MNEFERNIINFSRRNIATQKLDALIGRS